MMRSAFRLFIGIVFSCIALAATTASLHSQQPAVSTAVPASMNLPDAPQAQSTGGDDLSQNQQTPAQQPTQAPTPAQTPAPPGNSSSQTPAQAPGQASDAEKSQHDKAEEQLKAQEHQRVMGVMATFNTTTNQNALPLSSGQKFKLFFKSETDPWPFLLAGVVSGVGMAEDSYPTWGEGAQGYGKRFGAAYTDAFIGNFFGNAVLTSLLHEDPRYFQKGSGKPVKRFLWAASSTVWCKRDGGGWGPNYANIGGNLIGAAISDAYYPASERTVGNTIENGLTVSAEGIVGAEIIEFWPDIARHYKQKKADKLARQAAQSATQGTAPDSTPKSTPQ